MHQEKAVSSQRFQAVPQSVLHCATAPRSFLSSAPALGGPACTDHHLRSPAGFPQWKSRAETTRRREEGTEGAVPARLSKPWPPGAPSTVPALPRSSLENYRAPLRLSPRAPHPRVSPQPCSLFICTITLHDISFPLGPCLMQPAGPSRLIQKQYIVSINLI